MTIDSDRLAGLLFILIGFAAIALGWSYGLGTMNQLGSGAMPVLVGAALCGLGIAQLLRATRQGKASLVPAFDRSELRPLLVILGAVLAFAVLILPTGLVPALAALIAIAWFAQAGGTRLELAGAMVVVIVVIVAIFKHGLGLPLRLFAWGF